MLLTRDDNLKKAPIGRCVYVLHCDRYFKIGYTNHIHKRLSQLQVGSPHKISIVCLFYSYDAPAIEQRLHEKFAEYSTKGEWFLLPQTPHWFEYDWPPTWSEDDHDAYKKATGRNPVEYSTYMGVDMEEPDRTANWHYYDL